MPVLRLPSDLHKQLRDLALSAYPLECCGLLIGRRHGEDFTVTRLVPAQNIHPAPHHNFELDPATHFAVLRDLRAASGAETVLGHYHSHPDGQAMPSARDLAQTYDPAMLWLILAATHDHVAPPTAWLPRQEAGQVLGFDPVPLEITAGSAGVPPA